MGLTRPGGIAACLGKDFVIHLGDIPLEPEPAEPNRDLPPEITVGSWLRCRRGTTGGHREGFVAFQASSQ